LLVPDPAVSQVGPGIPSKDVDLLTFSQTGTVLALASLFEKPGRITGWELNVQATGTIKVLVSNNHCIH
jgi:hypothetical protein